MRQRIIMAAGTKAAAIAAILLLTLILTSSAQTVPTNIRMQNVVKEFVKKTGQQLIGLGSWISGTNYNDVLTGGASDHDLRLVIQRTGTTPAKALTPAQVEQELQAARRVLTEDWQKARRVLTELINQEFGKDASKILSVTNLYPPNQLMKGVEGAADAMQRFQQLGNVPNLGFTGKVGPSTPSKFVEGLYGEGAQVWTQMYEQNTGRLFYAKDGKAFAGMVDLTHLEEGYAKYSSGGMANTGIQWIEHAEEELAQGRGSKVAKYLERLERDLGKAKDLARLGGDPTWNAEIRDLTKRLKANPAALASLEGRITALLARSHMESVIIGRMAKAGPIEGAVLRAAIAGIAAKNKFGEALATAAQNIPVEQLIHGVIAIIVVKSGSSTAGEAGYLEALRSELPVLASLPVGVVMGLTNAILDAARSEGYSLVASYQDPWALLEGNFTAAGRVSVDERRSYTINELVKSIHTEEKLSGFVYNRSVQAAERGFNGPASSGNDSKAAAAIYERCYPPILRAWQTRREQLRMEYFNTADRLQKTVFPIVVNPASAKLPKDGKVDAMAELLPPNNSTLGRDLDRMKEILTWLNGGSPYALVTYNWVGGTSGARETIRNYSFNQVGTHQIVCNVEIVVNDSRLQAGDPLIQRVRRFSAVDVEIEGDDAYRGTITGSYKIEGGGALEGEDAYSSVFSFEPGQIVIYAQGGIITGEVKGLYKETIFEGTGSDHDNRTRRDVTTNKPFVGKITGTLSNDGVMTGSFVVTINVGTELRATLNGKISKGVASGNWMNSKGVTASGSFKASRSSMAGVPDAKPTKSAPMPTVTSSPDNSTGAKATEDLLKQGVAFALDKKYDEALKTFDKALSIDPDNSEALRQRGMAKRELKDLPGALEDFNSAIRVDPKNERAYVGRGITKERIKDVAGALADYDLAIAMNPKNANGYFYHGLLKLNQKDYQAATADFDRVIELEPANGSAHNNRGLAKAGLGNTAGAIADYEKAIALNPNDETAKKNLARLRSTPTTPATVEKELFSNGNIYGVENGGHSPLLEFNGSVTITYIMTYHWNAGRGAPTGTIALRHEDGTIFGPWKASGTAGQGGVPSVYWEVRPNIVIPAGRYQVIDSDPSTWAQNAQNGRKGMVVIKGRN